MQPALRLSQEGQYDDHGHRLACFLLELLQTPELIRVISSLITYFFPHFCYRPVNMEQILRVKFEHLCSSY